MKQTLNIQRTSSDILEDPYTVELNLTETVLVKIRQFQGFAKENNVAVNMPFYDYNFLNEEGEKFEEWRADVSYFRISEFGAVFYAQNKWDSSHQIETGYVNLKASGTMKNYSEYQFLIFSQIFYKELEAIDKVVNGLKLEYDLSYPIVSQRLEDFLSSVWNDSNHSEYDCMAQYILENINFIIDELN